jgi:hypothetical protein
MGGGLGATIVRPFRDHIAIDVIDALTDGESSFRPPAFPLVDGTFVELGGIELPPARFRRSSSAAIAPGHRRFSSDRE